MSRSDLASRLVQKLRTDNILVWEDGLSDLWDPNKGPDGGWKTNFNGPRYGPGPSPDGRLNRGPVWPRSLVPVTSCDHSPISLPDAFKRVLNTQMLILQFVYV